VVTPRLFEAYLACRTKCFLRSTGAVGDENSFAAWTERMNESYGRVAIQKLPSDGKVVLDHLCQSENSGVEIYALQTVGRGKTPQSKLIPLRFVASNKVSRSDRLMAAFDALIISKALRIRIDVAKIIYGDKRSALSIKTKMLFREVSKVIDDIRNLLSNSSPPTLVPSAVTQNRPMKVTSKPANDR